MLETAGFITLIIFGTIFTSFILFAFGSYVFGGPYSPSNYAVIKKALDEADIKEGTVFMDLGSGDGRVLVEAAKRGALAIGYEINPFWYVVSKLRIKMKGLNSSVAVKYEDFMKTDFSEADVIYIYTYTDKIAEIEELLKKDTKKEAVIISYMLPFPNWKEHKRFEEEKLFIYIKN